MKSEINVLLTGCGSPGAYGIIKCLRKVSERKINLIGADCDANAYGRNMTEKFYVIPKASSIEFIDAATQICKKEKIDVILPLVTRELSVFSKNIVGFNRAGVAVCVMDENALNVANNKALSLNALATNDIPVPKFKIVKDIHEFAKAAQYLGHPKKAFCFKPSISNGSRGFRLVSDNIDRADLLFNEKPNSAIITYKEAIDILSESRAIPELVVMEYLPNEEYSVDCLVRNGELIASVPRLRLKMNGGISVRCKTVNDEDIHIYCRKICRTLNLHGNIGIQVKRDENGMAKFLEINPRVQGTIVLCAAAGVNMPYLGIKLALGESLPKIKAQWGIELVRYWEEVYYDNSGLPFAY